jgi:hypothetical protein
LLAAVEPDEVVELELAGGAPLFTTLELDGGAPLLTTTDDGAGRRAGAVGAGAGAEEL